MKASLRVEGGAKGAKRGGQLAKPLPEPSRRRRRLRATSGWSGSQEKPRSDEVSVPVPQTDTGGRVENTQAHGRTLVKELGKMAA